MSTTLNPTDKIKLIGALKEVSTSLTRMDAERDLQKNIKSDICKELDLDKKVFAKLAKVWHNQNFNDEVEAHKQFEDLYTILAKTSSA